MADRIRTRLTRAEGRKFGLTVGTAFAVLGGVATWRGHPVPAAVFAALGGLLILAGLILPGRLGPVHRAWMGLAHAISKVTTPIVLGVIYFVVLAPVGVMMRLFGRNPIAPPVRDGSFWMLRSEAGHRRSDLERQF